MTGLGVAFLVALHAAGFGNATRVCRHAGEEMNPCACPHDRERTADRAVVSAESCCKIRTVSVEAAPAVLKGTATSPSKQPIEVWSVPKPLQALPREESERYVAARQPAPPSTPL